MTGYLARKARDATRIYRYHGLLSLVETSGRFVKRQLLKPWHLTGEEIYDACRRRIPVQSPETKTVGYEGRFRDSLPRQLAAAEGEISTPERVVGEYENAYLLGSEMIVRVGGKYVVPVEVGSVRTYSPRLAETVSVRDAVRTRFARDDPDRYLEEGFVLTGKRGLPFAHWFYETLPKLRWYERYCTVVGRSPPLMVPAGLADWQRASLASMGYPDSSVIEHGESVTKVKHLALPPHPYRNRGSTFVGSPANLRWMRNRILSNVSGRDRSSPDRIYLSRSDASRRRVRNEGELVRVLGDLGFVKLVASELSFEEQVRAFAGADVVVGAHGAGLTNVIYASDLDVVELLTDEGASEHFFVLANELDHSYEFVVCDPTDDDRTPPRHRDMVADPGRVREVVAGL